MSKEVFQLLQEQDVFPQLSNEELQQFAAGLQEASLFHSLDDKELVEIALAGRLVHFERGDVIINEGDEDKVFYVIIKGQVRVWGKRDGGRKQLLNFHETGDFFGELIFLDNTPRGATVDVVEDVDLLAFDQQGFDLIVNHNQISEYLQTWGKERIRRSNQEFKGKHWDEISVVLSHKSWVALVQVIFVPTVLIVLTWVTMILLGSFANLSFDIAASVVVAVTIAMGLWIFWMWEDWWNDEFIVTSKRIIHIERILVPPFPVERHEAPIDQVQDITTRNHIFWTWLFNVHTLEIKTQGVGIIRFPYLDNAAAIREEIFHARDLARSRQSIEEQNRIRQTLLSEMGRDVKSISPLESGEAPAVTPEPKGLFKVVDYFVPRTWILRPDRIIWRKHWIVLIKEVALSLLACFLSLVLLIWALTQLGALSGPFLYVVVILPVLGLLSSVGWYIWQYDGWRNDVYIVTDTRIIDIEGSPFHLRKESRTEGTFDVIQNTDYDSPNWLARILRVGDVTISTASKRDAFTFNAVARPEEVQQEVFKRLTAFREQRERAERERRHSELSKWFGIYHRSMEQGKE